MDRTEEQKIDDALVLAAQRSEEGAYEKLVQRWQSRLWRHAWRLTHNSEAASDIVQEAWLAMLRNLNTLDDPHRFPQWSYRIVTNKCADWTRRQQRSRLAMQTVAVDVSSEADTNVADDVRALQKALGQIKGDRRAILAMLYHDGMTLQQIAEVMDIPVGTVKSRLHAAREELRNVLSRLTR